MYITFLLVVSSDRGSDTERSVRFNFNDTTAKCTMHTRVLLQNYACVKIYIVT